MKVGSDYILLAYRVLSLDDLKSEGPRKLLYRLVNKYQSCPTRLFKHKVFTSHLHTFIVCDGGVSKKLPS